MSMTLVVDGVKVEDLKFRHLDYYDALAVFVNRYDAEEDQKPWSLLRKGSILTLCTVVIDGKKIEGWSHKVPQDQPDRQRGNLLALARAIKGMGRVWRILFWAEYFGAQMKERFEQRRTKLHLAKGNNVDTSKGQSTGTNAQPATEAEDAQGAQAEEGGPVAGDGSSSGGVGTQDGTEPRGAAAEVQDVPGPIGA